MFPRPADEREKGRRFSLGRVLELSVLVPCMIFLVALFGFSVVNNFAIPFGESMGIAGISWFFTVHNIAIIATRLFAWRLRESFSTRQIIVGGLWTHPQCGRLTSPTAVLWNSWGKEEMAEELTVPQIHHIQQCFISAAVRAQAAGYDGVQLHGCHGYLINDFASEINQRTDGYGGSTENRARFGCEIIAGIRKACGNDFIISVRTTGCDPTVEESIGIAECYVKAGCDYLQVSNGIHDISDLPHGDALPYNRVAALGVSFHEHFRGILPVSLVNGLRTPEQVRFVLENDLTDTVDLACGLLADPAFTEAILAGASYVKCCSCKHCGWGPGHGHVCPAVLKRNDEAWVWKK